MSAPRTTIVPCMDCDGEGWIEVITHNSREDGCPDGYRLRCENCAGTGGEEIELQPITLADLDAVQGAHP